MFQSIYVKLCWMRDNIEMPVEGEFIPGKRAGRAVLIVEDSEQSAAPLEIALMWVESEPGKGACFSLRLPSVRVAQPETLPA